jgi:hypothetical protein
LVVRKTFGGTDGLVEPGITRNSRVQAKDVHVMSSTTIARDPVDAAPLFNALRFRRQVIHLHELGPWAFAEFLEQLAKNADASWLILDLLAEYERRVRAPDNIQHGASDAMTADLTAADRNRLGKLLGMLGSDHQGEREVAARAAHRQVVQAGLTWRQVIEPPAIEKRLPEIGTWRATVAVCLERQGSLRPWEAAFLRDLPGFRRLSTKQRYVLNEIADRVLQREAAA